MQKNIKYYLFRVYIVILHLLIIIVLLNPFLLARIRYFISNDPTVFPLYTSTHQAFKQIDHSIGKNAVVFLGDSIMSGINTSAIVSTSAVNYGVGGDRTTGIYNRMLDYSSIKRAKAVIMGGVNDLGFFDDKQIIKNFKKMLSVIPPQVPVVISAILPIDERAFHPSLGVRLHGKILSNKRIDIINEGIKRFCSHNNRYTFVTIKPLIIDGSGNLNPKYHRGDGIHLNKSGMVIWQNQLKIAYDKLMSKKNN